MLVAKFVIPGPGGSKAEVNISATGGGLLANVNRWRSQLGLAPLAESALANEVQSLDVADGKATLIDMKGTDAKTGQPPYSSANRLSGYSVAADGCLISASMWHIR